jgi:hypothetical protein
MNATELKTRAALHARILNMKTVQRELARFPDADWSVTNSYQRDTQHGGYINVPVLAGSIFLGYIDPAEDGDIRDVATSADSDSWVLDMQICDKTLRGGVKVQVELKAYQKYAEDEIENSNPFITPPRAPIGQKFKSWSPRQTCSRPRRPPAGWYCRPKGCQP